MKESKFSAAPAPGTSLPWDIKTKFRKKFRFQASRSYMMLCLGLGIVAAVLPLLLILIDGLAGHYSISHFYYAHNRSGRDVFVGSLFAIGVFLILFQGLSLIENRLLNLAGLSALGVALAPMDQCQCEKGLSLHHVFAVTFFVCLAIVAVFYSKGRLEHIVWPALKRRLAGAYTACGVAMIVLPATVYALHSLLPSARNHAIFWTETAGIWAFSAYWFTKSWEYRRLLGIRLGI